MKEADIDRLVREHILSLKPYSSARDEYSGKEGIFLDANENSIGSATETPYNRYPDPYQWAVKEKLAALKGVEPEQILLGNGSDEVIDLLFRAFCEPNHDRAVITPPTYGMYRVSANINGVPVLEVPLQSDYSLDLEALSPALTESSKLLFLCSPNNPTGVSLLPESVEAVLREAKGLVVIDEAYIDFSEQASWLIRLAEFPNLVVMQTFSKAWGMAGLRLGMAFAHPRIVQLLNKIKPPYNINQVTQEKALEALEAHAKQQTMAGEILYERERLAKELLRVPAIDFVHPSDANFLLVKTRQEATRVYQYLVEKKIIVRDRSKVLLCEGCLRITVGTQTENNNLIAALTEIPF